MIPIGTFRWIDHRAAATVFHAMTSTTALCTRTPAPTRAMRLLPGLLFAGAIAGVATGLGALAASAGIVVSPLILALLLGLGLAQVRQWPAALLPGLDCAGRPFLRLAIVLLGLRIGLPQIAAIGAGGVAAIGTVVVATLGFGYWLGRRLGLSANAAWLLAAGHAICGAAAIAAADSVLRAKDREVAQALTLVTLLGTVAMLACPLLGHALALAPATYGFWAGGSIHEVAQAVAAGFALGDAHGEVASLVKMVRVAFLLPLGLFLAAVVARRGPATNGRRLVVPWFVVAFAGVAVVDAAGLVPAPVADALRSLGTAAMTLAMAALGLKSSLRDLALGGVRPFVVALVTTLTISSLALLLAPAGA